jgi:hypothetical protein
MTGYTRYCDHSWTRDDAHTKQCVRCGTYAEIREGEFA